jgi:transposase
VARHDTQQPEIGRPPANWPVSVGEWRYLHASSQAWIHAHEKQHVEMARAFGKNSHNSSLPPSRDGSEQKAKTNAKRRRGRGKRRRPGGQKGHVGRNRPLVPPERVSRWRHHHPKECRRCGKDLHGVPAEAEPLHHQIAEIPEIKPTVTDHVRHRVTCPDCHTTTTAPLPTGVPRSSFGVNLRSLVVLLSGRFRISRRETVELCRDVFGLSVSLGTIANTLAKASNVLAAPYGEVEAAAKTADVAYADETGWREKAKPYHLWIVVTALVMLFRIARRTKAVAQDLLGAEFAGAATTDRYAAYRWIADDRHQVCWNHLRLDFAALAERDGDAKRIGEAGRKLSSKLFKVWHAYRADAIDGDTMRRRMTRVEMRTGQVLQEGCESRDGAARSLCQSLRRIEPSLFVFARVPGVEPTNNISERGIRAAVQWRKICLGTQSRGGSRFVERILTVVGTCRQQDRPLLPYLRDVLKAADAGREIPSLLQARVDQRPPSHAPPTNTVKCNLKRRVV